MVRRVTSATRGLTGLAGSLVVGAALAAVAGYGLASADGYVPFTPVG